MSDPDESTAGEFDQAVGGAILAWQLIEQECAHLFSHLLGAPGIGAIAIFYHIKNHKTRIEMLNIAARFSFFTNPNGPLAAEWEELVERIGSASMLRNRIAHFEVDDEMTETGWKYSLKPPSWDISGLNPIKTTAWGQKRRSSVLQYSDIAAAKDRFRQLAIDVGDYSKRLFDQRIRAARDEPPLPKRPQSLASGSANQPTKARRQSPPKPPKSRKTGQ